MKRAIMVGALFVIGALGVFFFVASNNQNPPPVADRAMAEPVQTRLRAEFYGTVAVRDVVHVRLPFPVRVVKTHVTNGERVKRGDPLITLDITDTLDQLEQMRQSLAITRFELENLANVQQITRASLANELLTEQELYDNEQQQLDRKQSELAGEHSPDLQRLLYDLEVAVHWYEEEKAELEARRRWLAAETISHQEFDRFRKSVAERANRVGSIELLIEEHKYHRQLEIDALACSVARRQLYLRTLELRLENHDYDSKLKRLVLEGEVAQLQAEVARLEENLLGLSYLKDGVIIADMAEGIVFDIGYRGGDFVEPKQKILGIYDLQNLMVQADVPEEFAKDIELDAKVHIVPLADTSRQYHGRVTYISSMAEPRRVETVVPVQVSVDDWDDFLLPNFNVDVSVIDESE